MICGHTFCQDDLWNWFHRESASSDDGEDNLESDISDEDDQTSDAFQHDDVPEPSNAGADVPDEQEDVSQGDGHEERRSSDSGDSDTVYSGGSDLVPVEDDYNTDDPVDESESSRSPSPVAVRRGVVIRTTRGEQALRSSRLPPRRSPQLREPTHGDPSDAPESDDANVSPPANAGNARQAPTPGRQGRVPPAKRPRRKNLVCPQCRSRVSLPPFPVFAIRSMSDLLAAHTTGRRHESVEAERENNTAIDVTWGGLFPRAAR